MGAPGKKKSPGGKKKAGAQRQLSAEEHFENAEMAFAMEAFDQARASFKRALDMEPENIEYIEGFGSFLAEVGPPEEAVALLQRAVAQQPDEGFEKYMYLGQLLDSPQECEAAVRKGVAILRSYIQQQAQQPPAAEGSAEAAEAEAAKAHLDATLASCLCSLAETLLNRGAAAGEEGLSAVEGEIEGVLGEARQLAPTSPEPLQALASLRQQQGKPEEALAVLRQSLALWFKPAEEEEGSEGEEEGGEGGAKQQQRAAGKAAAAAAAEAEEEELGSQDTDSDEDMEGLSDDEEELPSYEFRFEAAKLLLELDDSVETASQILEQLLDENDMDPNVYLLLAMCCQGGGDLEAAAEVVEDGLKLCKSLKLPADDETLAGFEAMQAELAAMLKEDKAAAAAEGGDAPKP